MEGIFERLDKKFEWVIDVRNSQVHGIVQVVMKRYRSHMDSVNYKSTLNILLV